MKKGILLGILLLIILGIQIGQSRAQVSTTITDSQLIDPLAAYTNLSNLRDVRTNLDYGFNLSSYGYIRFIIMEVNESEFWQNTPNYHPICILNITTYSYLNQTFRFPEDGDYIYRFENEIAAAVFLTLIITKPGLSITGFPLIGVFLCLCFFVGVLYFYRIPRRSIDQL